MRNVLRNSQAILLRLSALDSPHTKKTFLLVSSVFPCRVEEMQSSLTQSHKLSLPSAYRPATFFVQMPKGVLSPILGFPVTSKNDSRCQSGLAPFVR